MALIYDASFNSQTRVLSLLDKAGNVISSCEVPSKELVDNPKKPLMFKATQDGSTVKLSKTGTPSGAFQVSRDGGNTWTDYTIDTAITLNIGDEVSFRTKSDRTSKQNYNHHFKFFVSGKIEAWHNVMSMYRTNDFATYNSVLEHAFHRLFMDCTSLTKAPVLPATTLANYCYYSMFSGCTSLTQAPVLPATTLANYCYTHMFEGCDSLTKAPVLPATTLAEYCYNQMFKGCASLTQAPQLPATTLAGLCYRMMFKVCTSLTQAPVLPATTLVTDCYRAMFSGCTSLTQAPVLPATTLANSCYSDMFSGCRSLRQAPELPATTLANYCYRSMFSDCTSLTQAPVLPATTLNSYCYEYMFYYCSRLKEVRIAATTEETNALNGWLYGVSETGDFYCDPSATIFPTDSISGIPKNWTRRNIADYPN